MNSIPESARDFPTESPRNKAEWEDYFAISREKMDVSQMRFYEGYIEWAETDKNGTEWHDWQIDFYKEAIQTKKVHEYFRKYGCRNIPANIAAEMDYMENHATLLERVRYAYKSWLYWEYEEIKRKLDPKCRARDAAFRRHCEATVNMMNPPKFVWPQ